MYEMQHDKTSRLDWSDFTTIESNMVVPIF